MHDARTILRALLKRGRFATNLELGFGIRRFLAGRFDF